MISVNRYGKNKLDTVGPPLKGVTIKIADDGEILVSGELVMNGCWNRPQETSRQSATAGCTPAISASLTKTAARRSPTARKTSSSIPAATMFRRSGSRAS